MFILGQLSCSTAQVTSFDITNSTSAEHKVLLTGQYGILAPAKTNDTYILDNEFKVTLDGNKQSSKAKINNPNDKDIINFLPVHQAVSLSADATQSLTLTKFLRLETLKTYFKTITDAEFFDFYQDGTSIKVRLGANWDDIKERLSAQNSVNTVPYVESIITSDFHVVDQRKIV